MLVEALGLSIAGPHGEQELERAALADPRGSSIDQRATAARTSRCGIDDERVDVAATTEAGPITRPGLEQLDVHEAHDAAVALDDEERALVAGGLDGFHEPLIEAPFRSKVHGVERGVETLGRGEELGHALAIFRARIARGSRGAASG